MQEKPFYEDTTREVREGLLQAVDRARKAGIADENIILDPGIGFGKRLEDNIALLGQIDQWRPEGFPLLVGLSRKSFLGLILDEEDEGRAGDSGIRRPDDEGPTTHSRPDDRLIATIAAHAWCLTRGADILRVHDVKETRQLIAVWEALAWAS